MKVKVMPFLEKPPKITAKKLAQMKKDLVKKTRELEHLRALIIYAENH